MSKILVIGASNSTTSINRVLASHAAKQLTSVELTRLDLNDFEMPLYSPEREEANGVPDAAKRFVALIAASDGVILSLAEHNGSYTAAFKNVLDWASRHQSKLWSDKPMLLLSTSPGGRGAASVMEAATSRFPHLGAKVSASFSLPAFYDNYSEESGITDEVLRSHFGEAVARFQETLPA